jgi:hypothetical protein
MSPNSEYPHEDNAKLIFSELKFRSPEVKNRLFRSNVSGMFDDYNGHGGNVAAELGREVCPRRGRLHHLVGYFLAMAVYMIAEKAADVILSEANS